MFKKILIANRGEIAVRVIRSCREMGIEAVAVHSEADAKALHVRLADEAYCVGPPPSRESYLVIEKIIDAAKKSGADAIHPGYGFLSENAEFVRACDAAGIAFIGPPAEAMERMGIKTSARKIAEDSGAPIVPGTKEAFDDMEKLAKVCDEIGYPILLKASAGGGGKGMRLVKKESKLIKSYERARSEAANAFGNDEVYVEKFIVNPRHIEVQVFVDAQGNALHFYDRECTLQRRHQKVVEEAPSDFVSDETRPKLYEAALAITQQVEYRGAGTIEFVMDPDQNFYFLEMNTRLQVEHPVTEMITGKDLVKAQILTAAGLPLGYGQEEIKRNGYALECRVYAENPAKSFMPSPGTITGYRLPGGPGTRVDSGVQNGAEVSVYYDPLVAKLAVRADNKPDACRRMARALEEYRIKGLITNIPFHRWLMKQESFIESDYSTAYIEEQFKPEEMNHEDRPEEIIAAGAVAKYVLEARQRKEAAFDGQSGSAGGSGWRNIGWRKNRLGR